jgi:DNA topoisomerase-1
MKPTLYLVLVESPAKCKKIESYLGPGYKVIATFGHIRHIPDLKSIDIENNFAITFETVQESLKGKQIEKLRKEISAADEIILATDDDREGESIAWHVCDLFNLSVTTTKRIVFREITESAIQAAIKNPTRINMNVVNAQQSRQVLDMLVGFKITPFLWKFVSNNKTNSLSAGRCQTPALRLVYDNYIEIQNSPGKMVHIVTGYFTNMNILFELNKQFYETQDVSRFLTHCKTAEFLCSVLAPKKVIKKAPEPLTTSTLQQLASNELHMSPKETMKHAQQLYEGGYITYMRTDSKKYSEEFVTQVKTYIEKTYDNSYISQNIDGLINKKLDTENKKLDTENKTDITEKEPKKTKKVSKKETKEPNTLAQEAHEAIRPVMIQLRNIEDTEIQPKALKLYLLIWKRTLESCMPSAQYSSITAKITIEPIYEDIEFSYKAEQISFPGWQIVEGKYEKESKEYKYFSSLKKETKMVPKKIESKFTIHELTSHYTEARLVQLLEEKGIGRPSTFASLLDKIQERGYVTKQNITGREITGSDFSLVMSESKEIIETNIKREFGNEKNKLVIQPIGIIVIELLIKHFNTFFNYEYTKNMEDALDLIANGHKSWTSLCESCNNELIEITEVLKEEKKFSLQFDEQHELVIGKYGPVVKRLMPDKTITFLPCKKDLDINTLAVIPNLKLEDVLERSNNDNTDNGSIGKYKGEDLFIKKGKYGLYAKWGSETKALKELGNRPIENIKYLEVLQILDRDTVLDPERPVGFVRELSPTISIRTGKYGDYIFYKKPRAKKAEFLKLNGFGGDYKKCDKSLILNWVKNTYNISE